jgi:phosphoglucosamine mutase
MRFFGSSGIRGLANDEITPQFCMRVGKAVGSLYRRVVIGMDPRTTGPMLKQAVSAGLLSTGAHVYDVGMVSTPTLAFATRSYDAGIMITASHNPAEYNGVKLWNPDGTSFMTNQMHEIEELLMSGDFSKAKWNHVGDYNIVNDAIERHQSSIIGFLGKLGEKLTVVLDCGSGAGSTITPFMLRELGCKVITLNSQPDGYFPGREVEPTDESLGLLKEAVKASGANLGLAHDGDADRMMAVDDTGKLISTDHLLAIMAKFEAKERAVVPVNASKAIEVYNPDLEIIRCRVGDAYVSEAIKKANAGFGGEPSGVWIFPRWSLCPDGIFAAARLVKICERHRISDLISEMPVYYTQRKNFSFNKDARNKLLGIVEERLHKIEGSEMSQVDGFRLEFEDGWVLVRFSGTEPKIRMTCEAENEASAIQLCSTVGTEVDECIKESII